MPSENKCYNKLIIFSDKNCDIPPVARSIKADTDDQQVLNKKKIWWLCTWRQNNCCSVSFSVDKKFCWPHWKPYKWSCASYHLKHFRWFSHINNHCLRCLKGLNCQGLQNPTFNFYVPRYFSIEQSFQFNCLFSHFLMYHGTLPIH